MSQVDNKHNESAKPSTLETITEELETEWRNSSTVSSIFHTDLRCIISPHYKRIHAFALWICYFAIALNDYIFGPTFNDLAAILQVDFASIAYFTVIRELGYTFGGLSGIVFNYVNRQLVLVILLFVAGATLFLTPYSSSLGMFYVWGVFNGLASGACDCGFHVWIMELFGSEAGPYVQGLHVFFGLGITVAPLITASFLSPEAECASHVIHAPRTNTSAFEVSNIEKNRANIFIPYAIIGSIVIACGLVLLVLFLYKRYHPPIVRKLPKAVIASLKKKQPKTELYTVGMVFAGSVMLGAYFGLEATYFQYIASFATASPLPIQGGQSAHLESATGALYTLGGAAGMLASRYFRPQWMIYANFTLINVANVLLVFWGFDSLLMLWIGNLIMGLGFGSTFATAYTFLEHQVAITNLIGSLFLFATGVGMSVFPLAMTNICDQPMNLIYVTIAATNSALLVFIGMHVVSERRLRRGQQEGKEIKTNVSVITGAPNDRA